LITCILGEKEIFLALGWALLSSANQGRLRCFTKKVEFAFSKSGRQIVFSNELLMYYDAEDAKMLLGRSNKIFHEPHGLMKHTHWIETSNIRLQEKGLAAREYDFEHI